jgi:hypothetical protein
VTYLVVSLGGILGDIIGGILILLMVLFITATATAVVEYCSCSVILGLFVWCAIFGETCALLVICWF